MLEITLKKFIKSKINFEKEKEKYLEIDLNLDLFINQQPELNDYFADQQKIIDEPVQNFIETKEGELLDCSIITFHNLSVYNFRYLELMQKELTSIDTLQDLIS